MNRNGTFRLWESLLVLNIVALSACGESGRGGERGTHHIDGGVEKGPFVLGSTVFLSALDADGRPTGHIFATETINDAGEFAVDVPQSDFVSVEASGFYYNELTGSLSGAPLTLRSIGEASSGRPLYVNTLTHLVHKRVLALVEARASAGDVATQAEAALRTALGIGPTGFDPHAATTETTLLQGDDDASAYLLAVGAVLLQAAQMQAGPSGPVDATFQELLNTILSDFAASGDISPSTKAVIHDAEVAIDGDSVMANLAARFPAIGATNAVPDIHRVLDPDEDDVPDIADNCPDTFNPDQADGNDDGIGDPCQPPDCSDGQKNQDETDVDCGGSCLPCPDGSACATEADCASSVCSGTCQVPTCTDDTTNGNETGVDCGGGTCPGCAPGSPCNVDSDCLDSLCSTGICASLPTCTDGVKNGNETDVDCGGSCAAACPAPRWSRSFSFSGPTSYNGSVTDTRVDSAGNFIITGLFTDPIDLGTGPLRSVGSQDLFLAKLDTQGTTLWARSFGTSNPEYPSVITVDLGGNIIMAGYSFQPINFGDGTLNSGLYIAKLDPSGTAIWSKSFSIPDFSMATGIATDASGSIWLTGYYSGGSFDVGLGPMPNAGEYDVFLAKFDAAGSPLFSRGFGGIGVDYASGLATAVNGDVAFAVDFAGTIDFGDGPKTSAGWQGWPESKWDVAVARFDTSGSVLWSRSFGNDQEEAANSLCMDLAGNVLVTGSMHGSVDFGVGPIGSTDPSRSAYLLKLDADGVPLWSTSFDAAVGSVVATDQAGNVIAGGTFTSSAPDLGLGPLPTSGDHGLFLVKYTSGGAPVWTQAYGATPWADLSGLALDTRDDIVMSGVLGGTIDFGAGVLTGNSFVASFWP